MLIGVLAFTAAGWAAKQEELEWGGGKVKALPASSCAPVEYKGEGDPDVLMATDFPMQGSSRTQTLQIVGRSAYCCSTSRTGRPATTTSRFQACDDSTAQAREVGSGQVQPQRPRLRTEQQAARRRRDVQLGLRRDRDPGAERAPGGGLTLLSPANTYGC